MFERRSLQNNVSTTTFVCSMLILSLHHAEILPTRC
jgi:hypothetical protein